MATKKTAIDENATLAQILTIREQLESLAAYVKELESAIASTYVTKTYVQTYIDTILGDIMPVSDPITEYTSITGYIPLDIEKVLRRFHNIGGAYTLYDYRNILTNYDAAAKKGNINPYIAVAQMVKETDWGRSWWSQRPRRNPAGIGVTGEKSIAVPTDKHTWAFNGQKWMKGYSFSSWEVSTKAHIGHLLAYTYKDADLNEDQALLLAYDPRARFISADKRGKVKLLKDLDGNWAVPGINYGRSIATLANALKQ